MVNAAVLIVDDEERSRITIAGLLTSAGNEIHFACNGAEAIEQARKFHPDLILLDIMMPDIILMVIQMPVMDGIEATRKIKNTPKVTHIPIVALTALAMPGDRDRCIAAGAVEYLSKPISLVTLHKHIQKIVHEHSYVEHNH